MRFAFSDEQKLAAEVARRLFIEKCSSFDLRKLIKSDHAIDMSRWLAIVDGGFNILLLPDEIGGLGLTEVDFIQIAEAAGYVALPEPLVESAGIAAPMLAAIDRSHPLFLDPSKTFAIGHPCNPFVANADTAAALLLYHEGGTYLIDPSTVTLKRQQSIDPFRRLFEVKWQPGVPLATQLGLWDDALDRGALFSAAQCLGLAQRTLDLAVEYAKSRSQFGKPIGSYQAIKHLLANVQVNLEFARPVVYAASAKFPQRNSHSRALISHAKLAATAAADLSARTAVQVHGAMGVSWDIDVHLYLKRALALTFAWGDPSFHRGRLEDHVLQQSLEPFRTFESDLTAESTLYRKTSIWPAATEL